MTITDPEHVVRSCLGAVQERDIEAALDLLDPAFEWRNSGLPTLRGSRARTALRSLGRRGVDVVVEIHHLAVDGDVVLTERTDVIGVGPLRSAFWVCGTFVVRDGRIVLWDDHFSTRNFLAGTRLRLRRPARGQVESTRVPPARA